MSGAELLPGDEVLHPSSADEGHPFRTVYTVLESPAADPGTWQLRCRCRNAAGAEVVISVPPTAPVTIEREETA